MTLQKEIDLSVVIPAWNEGRNVGPLVAGLWKNINALGLSAEIIIADGGSRDETCEEASKNGARVILQRRLGYGGALREGFMQAAGKYVLTMDCDLSHPPDLLPVLWQGREIAEVTVASRFVAGGQSAAPLGRKVLSRILNFVFSSVLAVPLKDSSSGYRLYRRDVLHPAQYDRENFNVLQEILVKAYSEGFTIREVPLNYEERAHGASHVSLVKFALSYLPTLFKLWKLRNSPAAADYEYRAYNSRHPVQRFWIRKRVALLQKMAGDKGSLLDIGCGSSYFTAVTPSAVGLDIEPGKVRFLRQKGAQAVEGRAEALPFPDENFERVVISQLLPSVSDPRVVIDEARRVLKMGGTLVVAVPDSRRLGWRMIGAFYRMLPNVKAFANQHSFSRGSLVDLLADCGFRALKYRYIFGSELILSAIRVE
ncbi:MAG: glycosyltransferase [Chthoniobacteraceae bacterium]